MDVIKRDGRKEPIMFDKITARVRKLCYGLNEIVDPVKVAMRVIEGLYDGVTTSELDNLAAETAATLTTSHPDYARLAARISVSNLHKNTKKTFSEVMKDLYEYINPRTGKKAPLLSDEVYEHIIFDGKRHESVLWSEELRARSIVTNSFGKTFHATGWRIGYMIAPAELMNEMYGNNAVYLLGGSLLRYGDKIGEGISEIKNYLH